MGDLVVSVGRVLETRVSPDSANVVSKVLKSMDINCAMKN